MWPLYESALALALATAGMRVMALRARVRLLEGLAVTDPLTGAFNRRHLDQCLVTAIERRARLGEGASLLLIDVDRFKQVNDTLGHPAGDHVLRSIAAIVGSRARRVDALFRAGGEEFALLLAGADLHDATKVAEELRAAIERAPLADEELTVSIGISDLRAAHTSEGWMQEADAALYLAKRAGRNRVATRDGPVVTAAA
jgi:diguanylate cyclase (GGDEF)-like protein